MIKLNKGIAMKFLNNIFILILIIFLGGCEYDTYETSSSSALSQLQLSEESLNYKQVVLDAGSYKMSYRFYGNGKYMVVDSSGLQSTIADWDYNNNANRIELSQNNALFSFIEFNSTTLQVGTTVNVSNFNTSSSQYVLSINSFNSNLESLLETPETEDPSSPQTFTLSENNLVNHSLTLVYEDYLWVDRFDLYSDNSYNQVSNSSISSGIWRYSERSNTLIFAHYDNDGNIISFILYLNAPTLTEYEILHGEENGTDLGNIIFLDIKALP